MKELCSYCGGKEIIDDSIDTFTCVKINKWVNGAPSFEESRDVCYDCYVKVFDTILGPPKKADDASAG